MLRRDRSNPSIASAARGKKREIYKNKFSYKNKTKSHQEDHTDVMGNGKCDFAFLELLFKQRIVKIP
jgi:hypothetical protein